MKIKPWFTLLFLIPVLFVVSCNIATPEKYFDLAVLNTNFIMGFADNGLSRELESPSVKLVEGQNQPVQMLRKEVIQDKLKYLEESFKKLSDLKQTEDANEILQKSKALYEFVLPVYKTEYNQLALLYDENASRQLIEKKTAMIHDKYYAKYNELYMSLINSGKAYATRHSIKVNWNM